MKKILFVAMMLLGFAINAKAQQESAQIQFEQITINLGEFSESDAVRKCVFEFTNVGTAPLVINQAVASCGCTVPSYTKKPIKPGEKGEIKVTYNGSGKIPGHFKKTITVRTNGEPEMTRLYIEGEMTE